MFLTSMEIVKPIDKNTSFAQKSYLKRDSSEKENNTFFFSLKHNYCGLSVVSLPFAMWIAEFWPSLIILSL